VIKILFPPGGYGTYLARCLYGYTNLNDDQPTRPLEFDLYGSSHDFRKNINAKSKIWQGHLSSCDWTINSDDSVIIVLPHIEHYLDYYDNQFAKHHNYGLVDYISCQLSVDEINFKLKNMWNYDKPFDTDTPLWILREFFSMWIRECFDTGYSVDLYKNVPARYTINTQDIILNFNDSFDKICLILGLTKLVDNEIIIQTHKNFLQSQIYHNRQLDCQQWVDSTLSGSEMLLPDQTIFDESYIQHIFRTLNYEIRCEGLEKFPSSSIKMQQLIYKVD